MKVIFIYFLCVLFIGENVGQRTSLDNPLFMGVYRMVRQLYHNVFGIAENENLLRASREQRILQDLVAEDVPFFCDTKDGRSSPTPPTSVHKLRPGDIDVIGALGDSLTAGFGALAPSFLNLIVENRGVTATGGGQATWRKYLTIPNILKEFNPNLTGYATTDALTIDRNSRFNVAESGAMSRDTPYMANILVKRMKSDPAVDIKNHWKMITIMIGPNDFCIDVCYLEKPLSKLQSHKLELLKTLRTLRDNLPRTIVNIVPTPSMRILVDLTNRSPICTLTVDGECPCFFGLAYRHKREEYYALMRRWQMLDYEISRLEEFDRDDFTVVYQPFTLNITNPLGPDGFTDWTLFAKDCFHISQKGNARVANALWNNMMEPTSNKTENWRNTFEKFNCPTPEYPFIRTNHN